MGAQVGGELNTVLLILNTREALTTLMGSTNLKLGVRPHAPLTPHARHAPHPPNAALQTRRRNGRRSDGRAAAPPQERARASACRLTQEPSTPLHAGQGNLSVAAGPFGRQIEGTGVAGGRDQWQAAACYSYAVSRGLFAGIALDGMARRRPAHARMPRIARVRRMPAYARVPACPRARVPACPRVHVDAHAVCRPRARVSTACVLQACMRACVRACASADGPSVCRSRLGSAPSQVLFTRDRLNHNFYGHPASATQLLSGKIPPPRAAEPLYRALRTHTSEYAP